MYLFAKEFGYTPQQIKEMSMDDYHLLKFAFDEVQDEQKKEMNNSNSGKGGSQVNGQQISSINDLISLASKEKDCKVNKKK
jgi:hypothetical protein